MSRKNYAFAFFLLIYYFTVIAEHRIGKFGVLSQGMVHCGTMPDNLN